MPGTRTEPASRVTLVAIGAGGALGSMGRYAVGLAAPVDPGGFPWATVVVNVSGALAMGLLVAFLVGRPGAHRLARPFVGVGLLGGWTTFSALALDVVQLTDSGNLHGALIYLAITFIVGVLAVAAGSSLGQRIWSQ